MFVYFTINTVRITVLYLTAFAMFLQCYCFFIAGSCFLKKTNTEISPTWRNHILNCHSLQWPRAWLPDVLDDPLHAVSDPLTAGGRTRLDLPNPILKKRCCNITLDSAMAASQNGFCSYKQAFHAQENQNYADDGQKYYIFINLLLS